MAPPLSVVIGTTAGWPSVRPTLAAIRTDAETVGAEVVVVDGSDNPRPTAAEIGLAVCWIDARGASIFDAAAMGMRAARGDVVATTEDHVIPHAGWIPAVIQAHADHPDAAAIGGAIENGSRQGLIDWASYFTTQGKHMAPLGDRPVAMTSNDANVSYKRWALERYSIDEGSGFMAILYNRRLADGGEALRVDDRMVVDHCQTVGFGWTTSVHFHSGRTISGFRRTRGMAAEDWLRVSVSMLLPAWRTLRTLRTGLAKGRLRRQLLASAPLALWLEYVQGVGHLVGYLVGPGKSPTHLR